MLLWQLHTICYIFFIRLLKVITWRRKYHFNIIIYRDKYFHILLECLIEVLFLFEDYPSSFVIYED